jgi:hypothetical protein
VITNLMPFDVRSDFVKVTGRHRAGADHHPDEVPRYYVCQQDGVQRGTVNIFGRVST